MLQPSNYTPKCTSKRNENIHPHKNFTYKNVHSSIIHTSQKVEIMQMSTNWPQKENVVNPYNGILYSNEKKY